MKPVFRANPDAPIERHLTKYPPGEKYRRAAMQRGGQLCETPPPTQPFPDFYKIILRLSYKFREHFLEQSHQ